MMAKPYSSQIKYLAPSALWDRSGASQTVPRASLPLGRAVVRPCFTIEHAPSADCPPSCIEPPTGGPEPNLFAAVTTHESRLSGCIPNAIFHFQFANLQL